MSTKEEDIEKALFTKALEYEDLPLVFPNDGGEPPADGTSHVSITHFRNNSEPYSLSGDGDARYTGILQMLVRCPSRQGSNEARKRGSDIVTLFWTPANLSLFSGATRVRITKRPVLGSAAPSKNDAWYEQPVSIYYESFI